jgi:prophage regulatory protein
MDYKVPVVVTIADSSLDTVADLIADRIAQRVEVRLDSIRAKDSPRRENPESPTVMFIRMKELRVRLGLSASTIYRKASEGTFPVPVKLGARTSAWRIDEIERWEAELGSGAES